MFMFLPFLLALSVAMGALFWGSLFSPSRWGSLYCWHLSPVF